MLFSSVRTRTAERFNEVQIFLNFITSQEPNSPREPTPISVKIMRGLFYVHLYSAFEKSINDAVETFFSLISTKSVKNKHYLPNLLSVTLHSQVKSLKDSNYSKAFLKSSELFVKAASADVSSINDSALSARMQNMWVDTIEEIVTILGIESFNLDNQTVLSIDEVVEKRNSVAHGRDSAARVGERYRSVELRVRMQRLSTATTLIIDSIEEHFSKKRFIKANARRYYA